MIYARLRTFLSERQGLNSFCSESSATVLAKNGWSRSVGGANPYLTLFARNRASKVQTEADIAALSIHEFASARGCTYILPDQHFQIGIKCSQGFNADSAIRTAKNKLGVTDADVDALKAGILKILQSGSLQPADMKDPLGSLFVNFGEAGKKVGQTTNISLGLLALQAEGRIRRVAVSGRLDDQNYAYALFDGPVVDARYPQEQAFRDLAALYWEWCGFASLAHFQWFSGLGVTAAKEAVTELRLEPLQGSSLLGNPEVTESYHCYIAPSSPAFRLIGGLDSLFLLRRDLALHFDDFDAKRSVFSSGKTTSLGALPDLSTHAIVDRGRIVGLWEYDTFANEIAWVSFVGKPKELFDEIERVQVFVREELGDARSLSLDSPKSRVSSINALRAMSG